MDGNEHRRIGDEAFGGALVNLGGEFAEERFYLGYGDVMALSGDYLRPEPSVALASEDARANPDALVAGNLFSLARVPGREGTKPDSRDEIVCALKVMTVDEAFVDPRFEPGGEFADFAFSALAASSDVERRVRDRYLELAATNDDHFVTPGGVTHERRTTPFGSAVLADVDWNSHRRAGAKRSRRSHIGGSAPGGTWTARSRRSVCVPAREEATTIAVVVAPLVALREAGVIDQVLVLDDDSRDATGSIAAELGADVVHPAPLLPVFGPVLGKGDAMWRALTVLTGDLGCFVDPDSEDFGAHFACGPR